MNIQPIANTANDACTNAGRRVPGTNDSWVVSSALEEVEQIIIPGLQKNRYNRSNIKHIIVTHKHFDHFGGVRYL